MPHIVRRGQAAESGAHPPVPDADGVHARWLVSAAHGEARSGMIAELTLDAGATQPLHRHDNAEEALVVLEGDATLLSARGERPAPQGTVVLARRDIWHGLRAGENAVRLLTVYGGENDIGALGAELADGAVDGDAPETLAISAAPWSSVHNPDAGFHHMGAAWLVSPDSLPSSVLVLGRSAYGEPDHPGGHALHRHLAGEEFLYLLDGDASHLTEDGEIAMASGDIGFMPAPEWHGIWNTHAVPAQSVFGYLGVDSLEAAGYEVHPASSQG